MIRDWVSGSAVTRIGMSRGPAPLPRLLPRSQLLAEGHGRRGGAEASGGGRFLFSRPSLAGSNSGMPVRLTDAGRASPFLRGVPDDLGRRSPVLQWHSASEPSPGSRRAPRSWNTSPACAVNALSWAEHAFSVQFRPACVRAHAEHESLNGERSRNTPARSRAALGAGFMRHGAPASMPGPLRECRASPRARILYRNSLPAPRARWPGPPRACAGARPEPRPGAPLPRPRHASPSRASTSGQALSPRSISKSS